MTNITDIDNRVRAELIKHQAMIISAFIDSICDRLEVCSYDTYLSTYTKLCVLVHKANKIKAYVDPHIVNTWEAKAAQVRTKLYAAPCKGCATCNNRRKAWPKK